MDATAYVLAAYCLAIAAASMLGGWIPSAVRMTHTRTQIAMSLAAGLVAGVALYHLLPHSFVLLEEPEAINVATWWTMAGLIGMVLLLRVFSFHQHDFSASSHDRRDAGNGSLSWLGIAVGMGLHSIIEGLALGASVQAARVHGLEAGLLGGGVFLAIFLHKPLDALSITGTMRAARFSARARLKVNLCFALLCPVGAALAYWSVGSLGAAQDAVLGRALAFSAGAFLCISLSDLLPEIHFHSHDRGKLAVAFLVGIALAYALVLVESSAMHHR